ncbi:MAG: DNA-processing protein DprA, partial [Clostridia bacterium]
LKHIYYPPLALYVMGELPDMDNEAAIAFVGTRKCTEYGIAATDRIAGEIARGGGLIVSGMALGIDSASHEAALRAGAKTVAVFGCGVDLCYPSEKKKLRLRIIENGAIISEYPPETSPDKTHFPARNRIISGISLGVVIAEAPEHRSGALITAACAAEQGRDVYAIPGNITSLQSVGTNQLIRDGAKPALCGADILNEYEAAFPQKINMQRAEEREIPTIQTLSDEKLASFKPNEQAILTAIMAGRKQIDEIIENTKQEAPCVLSVLTVLEITGVVRQTPGKIFEICV